MIKAISSPRIDWLINHIVSDESIMSLKPIIAGGSALSVYRAYRLYDDASKWRQLERLVEANDNRTDLLLSKLDKFGDIDAWFPEEHPAHNGGYGSWLLTDAEHRDSLISPLGDNYRDVKSSKWANSFRRKRDSLGEPAGIIFQAIKTPVPSVRDLFKSFDYINCCVAYHDGILYYDSRIDYIFNKFELRLNNSTNYKGSSMPKRVYSGIRAFKYAKRYHLDFSDELSYLVYKIYMDLGSIDYADYEDKVTLVNNVYGTTLMSKNDFKDMVKSFEQNFKYFTKMKTFKGEYAVYLIDRNLNGLKDYINNSGDAKNNKSYAVTTAPF